MYGEKMETLINAALADGVLIEKEKQILIKRAQEQGIDLDEFEMVLDARLIELQKAEKSAPKSTKFGDVRKCPVCGTLLPSVAAVCPDCGYEMSGIDSVMSSKLLAEQIAKIENDYNEKINSAKDPAISLNPFDILGERDMDSKEDKEWKLKKQKIELISKTIITFPIPNTKADLFEFAITMRTKMLSPGVYREEAEAYFIKYNEVLLKMRSLFSGDKMISSFIGENEKVLADYESIKKKQKTIGIRPSNKVLFGLLVFFVLVCVLLPVIMVLSGH